jgi:hypothetical protein
MSRRNKTPPGVQPPRESPWYYHRRKRSDPPPSSTRPRPVRPPVRWDRVALAVIIGVWIGLTAGILAVELKFSDRLSDTYRRFRSRSYDVGKRTHILSNGER